MVEYTSGASVKALSPMLPYRFSPKDKPDIVYCVETLSTVYSPVVSKTATQTYLTELRDIAKLTGKDFIDVLREELSSITKAADIDRQDGPTDPGESGLVQTPDSYTPLSPVKGSLQHGDSTHQQIQTHVESFQKNVPNTNVPTLKPFDVNPPELQTVIVEHILRTEDINSQINTPFRLRLFSGRFPRPNNEVDFESWRSNVELLLKDARQPDSNKSRRLIESLSSPAVYLVQHLPVDSPPIVYLEILDSAFGTVEDGDNLFAKYLNNMQNHGEEPSSYLQRIQVMLNTTLLRGGVSADELDKQLLKQFIRGCWDNDLISELQLEQKKQNPPSFADLLLTLRTAEERLTSKLLRMKQHLNATKTKVTSRYQGAQPQGLECSKSQATDPTSEIQDLKKQIANLQSHLASLKSRRDSQSPKAKSRTPNSFRAQKMLSSNQRPDDYSSSRPKPWYCFRCGDDGHIKPLCENEPNSSLVALKRKQLKEKQLAWHKVNVTKHESLN